MPTAAVSLDGIATQSMSDGPLAWAGLALELALVLRNAPVAGLAVPVTAITAAVLLASGPVWGSSPAATNSGAIALLLPGSIAGLGGAALVAVLESQRTNYNHLVSTSNIDFLGPLVLIIGIIVIIYGLLMVFLAWRLRSEPQASRRAAPRTGGPREAPA